MVDTVNFNGRRGWFESPMTEGSGAWRLDAKMRVTERFTRTAPDILLYQFTVDARICTQSRGPIPKEIVPGSRIRIWVPRGNYGMLLILSGARAEERTAEEAAAKASKQ